MLKMKSIATVLMGVTMSSLLSLGGCVTEGPPPTGKPAVEASFDLPPRQMVDFVKRVVMSPPASLPVESETGGVITTGWQSFPGEWHIARRWQERTRYFITISPDWDKPETRCSVSVAQETEQRPSSGHDWESGINLNRLDRAQNLLNQIRDAAGKS